MAYITIISTINSIQVDFGTYSGITTSTGPIPKKRTFQKNTIVFSLNNDNYIEAQTIYNNLTFPISTHAIPGTFIIDSINNQIPLDNLDLYNKLISLIQ